MAPPGPTPTELSAAFQEIIIVSISDLHTIPLSEVHIPYGDMLIVAGDLSEGRPAQLMQRLSELLALPHALKVVIGGNHDRALDPKCDARDAAIYNDLYERQQCRAAFREARESGVIYLDDESTDVTISGRVFNVFGSPKSLATSTNTAFGYPEDDGLSVWDMIPAGIDILVTHGPPAEYLSDDNNGCDGLLNALWRVRPMLHVFGHVHASYGTTELSYDDMQVSKEQHVSNILEARNQRKLREVESRGRYIPPQLRRKMSGGSVAAASRHVCSDFLARAPVVEVPVLVQGKTRLINAAIKRPGKPRGAIVTKILD